MTKCSLVILVALTLQTICGSFARPEDQHLSEKQIKRLKEAAAQWKEVINWEKKPCDDFYNYVCSNKNFPQPEIGNRDNYLKEMFSANPETMSATEEKFVKYATQCAEFKPEETDEFIKSFKFDSIGSWPAFEEKWDESKFNLSLAIAEMNSYNNPVIFRYDFTDTVDYFVNHFEISKQQLVDIVQNKELLRTKFEILGVTNPDEVFTDAALFEKSFNDAIDSVTSHADLIIQFSELKCPGMDWEQQVELVYGRKLPDDYPVILKAREELKSIYTAVSKLSPRVIANYFFCAFIYNTYNIKTARPEAFFMPVVTESILKRVYSARMKDIFKNLYLTLVEVFAQMYDFKTDQTAEHLTRFINEDIFGQANEEELMQEFKDITNDHGCMANYYHLNQLHKKRSAKHFFGTKNGLVNKMKSVLIGHFFYVAGLIEGPLTLKFEPLILMITPTVFYRFSNESIFTNEQRECFAQQVKRNATDRDMNLIRGTQVIFKIFGEWSRNYPEMVQEENMILKEYDLSVEKLCIISVGKYFCDFPSEFETVMAGSASAVECPSRSKWGTDTKCTYFTINNFKAKFL